MRQLSKITRSAVISCRRGYEINFGSIETFSLGLLQTGVPNRDSVGLRFVEAIV